jgi:hypothetical protein
MTQESGDPMPHHGEELGADLYELWVAAQIRLPAGAQVYAQANRTLARTYNIESLCYRDTYFTGDSYGPTIQSWKKLRDTMQAILGSTSENMQLAADALNKAITYYETADYAARDKVNSLLADSHNTVVPRADSPIYPDGNGTAQPNMK